MADETQGRKGPSAEKFPVLPLRDIVVFPYMIVPLFVGREKSINALEEVMRTDKKVRGGTIQYSLPRTIGRMAGSDSGWTVSVSDAIVREVLT